MANDFNFDFGKFQDVPTTWIGEIVTCFVKPSDGAPILDRELKPVVRTAKDGTVTPLINDHDKLMVEVRSENSGKVFGLGWGFPIPLPGETPSKRSDLGKFLGTLAAVGVTLGSNPQSLVGQRFLFTTDETYPKVNGKPDMAADPKLSFRIVGKPGVELTVSAGTAVASKLPDDIAYEIASLLNGSKNDIATIASRVAKLPDKGLIKQIMSGQVVPQLIERGMLTVNNGVLAAA